MRNRIVTLACAVLLTRHIYWLYAGRSRLRGGR